MARLIVEIIRCQITLKPARARYVLDRPRRRMKTAKQIWDDFCTVHQIAGDSVRLFASDKFGFCVMLIRHRIRKKSSTAPTTGCLRGIWWGLTQITKSWSVIVSRPDIIHLRRDSLIGTHLISTRNTASYPNFMTISCI
jgi:hypothetical protein